MSPLLPYDVICDFCPRKFKPISWNQRTCPGCASRGEPDQSKMPGRAYQAALRESQRRRGVRPALTEQQAGFGRKPLDAPAPRT